MVAALMPVSQLRSYPWITVFVLLTAMLLVVLGAHFWCYRRSLQLTAATQKLASSLELISGGTLSNTVPPDLLAREDEFGVLAHAVVDMQSALRELVERDALTGLYNRRFCQKRLRNAFEKTRGANEVLSIALGDIDFFKKFNDTYGHDCGDFVLSTTAQLIQDQVKDYGFCSRWGGEEFLIVLNAGTYAQHQELMQALVGTISENKVTYHEHTLSVSITFGLLDTAHCSDIDEALSKVDHLLYKGKNTGRNRLVM
jgi:diguanylate cyclase (GGDEF)-like protein